ncbi:hypothetical protein CNMCM5623_001424 [Aspergillus felis]|uniref:DOMON domain-containing protein n=1 Tax=Aspergillus felis TaxID=1287682 RepID=A0A8H6PMJ8_9EURO|nr:hypothetical protein CNMCM5623_001424 [Aspergillus felis]
MFSKSDSAVVALAPSNVSELQKATTAIHPSPPNSPSPAISFDNYKAKSKLKDGAASRTEPSILLTPPTSPPRSMPELTNDGQQAGNTAKLDPAALKSLLSLDDGRCGCPTKQKKPCKVKIAKGKKAKIDHMIKSMLTLIPSSPELEGELEHLAKLVHSEEASAAVSTFTLPLGSNSENYTFALNIPDNSSDVYFHLSGPTSYSWVAVGTGQEMKNSLMILLYSDASGKNVTVSPRLCTGETEPLYASSLAVQLLPGTGIVNGFMTVNGRCSNCTKWNTGSLDLQSTSQQWIFALGPHSGANAVLRSDSKTASIERHSKYGRFSMDMTRATGGSGGLPDSYTSSIGASLVGGVSNDSNWPAVIHAVAVCGAFILLMPTGVVLLRVAPGSVRWHWVNQTVASVIAIIGILIGFWLSTMYTKSQSFNSSHQIIGILVAIAMIAQWGVGFWHHRLYKLRGAPTFYVVFHRYFGHIVMFFAIVNGGIGLKWSSASTGAIIGYAIAVIIVCIPVICAVAWKKWAAYRGGKGYVHRPGRIDEAQQGSESDIGLNQYPTAQYPPKTYIYASRDGS